jgi:hypothetical protein
MNKYCLTYFLVIGNEKTFDFKDFCFSMFISSLFFNLDSLILQLKPQKNGRKRKRSKIFLQFLKKDLHILQKSDIINLTYYVHLHYNFKKEGENRCNYYGKLLIF